VGIGHPNGREPILAEELQEVGGITPVRLGLAHDHGANSSGIPHEQGMTLALHQRVKPLRVAGALDADRDGARQGRVEVLDCLVVVREATCLHLPCLRVQHRDVLLPGVEVASDDVMASASSLCGVMGRSAQPLTLPLAEGRSHDIRLAKAQLPLGGHEDCRRALKRPIEPGPEIAMREEVHPQQGDQIRERPGESGLQLEVLEEQQGIRAVQIWTFRASALVPTKVLIFRFCFSALKNSSICQRSW
jgi:hypothetical protein